MPTYDSTFELTAKVYQSAWNIFFKHFNRFLSFMENSFLFIFQRKFSVSSTFILSNIVILSIPLYCELIAPQSADKSCLNV
jgi:hypothetical protein